MPVRPQREKGPQGLTEDGRLKTGRLAGMTMGVAIWTVAWPVLVDSVLGSLVGLSDTVVAANLKNGGAATDAIGNASYIMWFCGTFLIALDIGATALISRSIGGGRKAVANAAVGQAMLLALVIGVSLGLLLLAVSGPLAVLMRMTPDGEQLFLRFLRIVAVDMPFLAVMYAGIACLRGSGDSFRPMRAMIVVNIVNLGLSWALSGADYSQLQGPAGHEIQQVIIHNPFPFHMGVGGIAVGVILAHFTGAMLIVWTLLRGSAGLTLKRHRLRAHWHTMRRILRVGFPNFLETIGMWAGNFPVILMAGWIAKDLVGAHILAVRIEAFSFQPGFAVAIAAATLTGQYLGAGSEKHARKAILVCTALSSVIMGAMGLFFIFGGRTIVGWLSAQTEHLDAAPKCLAITGLVQIPFAISIVFRQAMRGAGDVKVVMWITWITTYAIRLPLAYALSSVEIPVPQWAGGGVIHNPVPPLFGEHATLAGLWAGLCVEILFRAALFTARFVQGGWARIRV
jgi:putative MATE family efflux protein